MSSATRGNRSLNGSNSNRGGANNRRYPSSQRSSNNNNSSNNSNSNQQQRSAWGATLNNSSSSGNRHGAGARTPADNDALIHMHDRLVYLFAKSVGSFAIVTVASGARYRGILVAATTASEIGVVLELVEKYAAAPGDEDDDNKEPERFDKMVFQPKDIVDIEIESPDLSVEKVSSATRRTSTVPFKTDTDISGQKGAIYERELERWSAGDDDTGLTLEQSITSSQPWDQFAVNQNKFGVQSTYDEHLYTTAIDKSHPEYEKRVKIAEKLADEITNQSYNGNVHIAEERGVVVDDSGLDEEDKYSGVDRRAFAAAPSTSRNPNKYTPPALRNKEPDPHHDPAIISSSIATSRQSPLPKSSATTSPVPPTTGGTSTPISDLFKASKGIVSADQQSKNTPTSGAATNKPMLPSVFLPTSTRASKNGDKETKESKAKGTGKTQADTESIQKGLAGDFRDFVNTEVEKVQQKKQSIQSMPLRDKIDDLLKFSNSYKINTPVPPDLVPILGRKKDEHDDKHGAKPATASSTGKPKSTASTASAPTGKLSTKISEAQSSGIPPKVPSPLPAKQTKPASPAKPATPTPVKAVSPAKSASPAKSVSPVKPAAVTSKAKSVVVSPTKADAAKPVPTAPKSQTKAAASPVKPAAKLPTSTAASPAPTGEKKLNLNFKAPEFRPNPAAHSFTPSFVPPGSSNSSNHASPALPHIQPAGGNNQRQSRSGNLFFGNKPLHNKSRAGKFNPFTHNKELHDNEETPYVIPRSYITQPTWDQEHEKSYTEFLPNDAAFKPIYAIQRGPFIPPPGAAAGGIPMMQPGFDDPRNFQGPPMHGFIPYGAAPYGNAPQFFNRAPPYVPMGQQMYMFNPSQGYQSPRGPKAMPVPGMTPPMNNYNGVNGFSSPQQQHQQPFIRNGSGPNHGQPRYHNNHHNNHHYQGQPPQQPHHNSSHAEKPEEGK